MECSFEGCSRDVYAKELCRPHYEQRRVGKDLRPLYETRPAVCVFGGCERSVYCKDLCKPHYEQQRVGKELRPLLETLPTVCKVEGCEEEVFVKSRQFCSAHYWRWQRGTLDGLGERVCINCGKTFTPTRRMTAKCCSDRCNMVVARLRKAYDISPAEVEERLAAQSHGCAICKQPIARGGSLHIDHCHKTLAVRGLLCGQCNRGLGHFRDDPKLLAAAIRYLKAS